MTKLPLSISHWLVMPQCTLVCELGIWIDLDNKKTIVRSVTEQQFSSGGRLERTAHGLGTMGCLCCTADLGLLKVDVMIWVL